jgi:hypothetical protein
LSGGIANLVYRNRLNRNRSKRLTGIVSDVVTGLVTLLERNCPLAGLTHLLLGVGHQPPWL